MPVSTFTKRNVILALCATLGAIGLGVVVAVAGGCSRPTEAKPSALEVPRHHIDVIPTDAYDSPDSYLHMYYTRDPELGLCTQVTSYDGIAVIVIDCKLLEPR